MKKIVCYGEILWDGLPTGKILGGAPLNLALRLSSLGSDAKMISMIGEDALGEEIKSELKNRSFDTSFVQTTQLYKSGYVDVFLNEKGSATYDIRKGAAWDFIEINEHNVQLVEESDVFVFGSLACRSEVSQQTLLNLIAHAKYCIFDVNLRSPHYDFGVIKKLMKSSHLIKMNDDELFEIAEYFGSPYNSLEQNIEFISEFSGCKEICITKGKHGAVFYKDGKYYYNSGFKIEVKDTVGAGDSFLATLIHYYVNGEEITKTLQYACAMGALVSGEHGANAYIEKDKFLEFVYGKKNTSNISKA